MVSATIRYRQQGKDFEGYAAWDGRAGRRPAVLVAHAWGGRDGFAEAKARALAELGYLGFALDMYGAGVLGSSAEENARLMQPLLDDRALLRSRVRLAVDEVRKLEQVDPSRIAAIGFCFGGLTVLDLARSGADVRSVVAFHGLFHPAQGLPSGPISAKVLALHGYDDPMAKPDQLLAFATEMTAAKADWQVHAYGHTLHAFTNPAANDRAAGTVYDPTAERRAWQAMRNFLEETLRR